MSKKAPDTTHDSALLTHRGLAELLGVSETTVKSYRRKFPGCIPVANLGKPIRFTQEAAKVCLKIRELFETGMSVEEVRARLAEEFNWISPENECGPTRKELLKNSAQPESKAETPQEVKNVLGSLSKAMITLSQQQNTILKKVQRLEESVGTAPGSGNGQAAAQLSGQSDENTAGGENSHVEQKNRPQNQPTLGSMLAFDNDFSNRLSAYEQKLEELTKHFENIPDQLSDLVQNMLGQALDQMLGEISERKKQDCQSDQATQRATVMPFRKAQDDDEPLPDLNSSGGQVSQEPPPRQLLTLPLVLRSLNGDYMSAAGKNRGRFSLNDLKALLAYNSPPPDHFMLRWEKDHSGWWFALEQVKADNPRCLRLLLSELNTQRGEPVVVITRLTDNGNDVHPSELLPFISGLSQ